MSEIVGIGPAQAALQPLLDSVEAAVRAASGLAPDARDAAITAQKNRLAAFRKSTRAADLTNASEVQAVAAVDKIALDLELELGAQQIEQDLQLLEQGAERLRQLTGSLDAVTGRNRAAAASIGLKPVKAAVDQMTAMVQSVKDLKKNLKSDKPDEAAVAKKIDDLVTQFEALRTAVSAVV